MKKFVALLVGFNITVSINLIKFKFKKNGKFADYLSNDPFLSDSLDNIRRKDIQIPIANSFNLKSLKKLRLFFVVLLVGGWLHGICQTEFDSLKRNSNLDTLYQPSQKPTFATEFAELKISGFVQPALYYDLNNVLNNDLFVTSGIPTQDITNISFNRYHMSANQSRLGFNFKFPKAGNNISAFIEGDFLSSTSGKWGCYSNFIYRLRHAYLTCR